LLTPSFHEQDVYAPIRQWNNSLLMKRDAGLGIHGFGRLKPGVTIAQARADMDEVTRNLAAAFPDADHGISASILPLKEQMIGEVRPFLLVLLVAVGFVLLIVCVNVASLLMARSSARSREFAVLRLILWQGARLALLGICIGIVGALALTRLMTKLLYGVSATDPLTFAGLALILAAAAIAACCLPARKAMRVDPMVALRYE
jgi:ABC-type antimicrobial peptide transport system permease subunit